MKETRLKRLHIVGFYLLDILEKAKLERQKTDQRLPGTELPGTRDRGWLLEGIFGSDGNALYLNCGDVFVKIV